MSRWFDRVVGGDRWQVAATLFVILADLVHRIVYDRLNSSFVGVLRDPSLLGVGVLLGVYLVWCVGLWLIGGLRSNRHRGRSSGRFGLLQILFLYPSLGFGIILILAVAHAAGLTSEASPLSDVQQQIAVGGALGLFFVHVFAAMREPSRKPIASGPGVLMRVAVIVLISELTLNLSGALWVYLLGDPNPGAIGLSDRALTWAVLSPLYLLFFAAPRFAFHARQFTWLSFLSGVIMALSAVWSSIDFVRLF